MIRIITTAALFGSILFMGCDNFFLQYGYNSIGGKVLYKQPFPKPVITMDGVDISTFKVIGIPADSMYADNAYYATDKAHVYYCGYVLPGSDGPSFKLLDMVYAKDKNQCYYKGQPIPKADPASFVIKNDSYSIDKNHVFNRTITIDHDASVFDTFPNSSVVHTAKTVSIYDYSVPILEGASFHFLAYNYYTLNGQLYFWQNAMPANDTTGFIAIDDWYSKTNQHVFYGNKIIVGADPATYRLIDSPYGRDDHHVFFFERIIDGANPKTFEVLNVNFQCARDKKAFYHEDKKITNVAAADLANKNHCINCTDSVIYFAGQ